MKKILLFIAFSFFGLGFGQNLNPADIDPSFNQFELPLNNYFINDSVSHCKVQADGKLLMVISNKRLVRLINNEIDPNFNTGTGFSAVYISPLTTRPLINGIEIQPDGKIIVFGSFKVFNGSPARNIIRLNADGSKDLSFNIGTGFYTSGSYDSNVTHVQYYPGGILVAGEFSSYNSTNTINNMAKLSISSGELDTSFSTGQTQQQWPIKFLILSNNKYLVFEEIEGTSRFRRRFSNGSYDSSFLSVNFVGNIKSILTQADGKIILCGNFTSYNGILAKNIVRLNVNGTVDESFITGSGFSDGVALTCHIETSGKIIIAGEFNTYNGQAVRKLIRLNTDGSYDSTFIGGVGSNNLLSQFSGVINTISKSIDGKLILSGSFRIFNSQTVNYLLKINSDGSIDSGFKNRCKGFDGAVESIIEQPDGKLVVTGNFYSYNGVTKDKIVRLNADGSIDDSFVTGTQITVAPRSIDSHVEFQSNGKMIVCSSFGSINGYVSNNYINRLNIDGSKDQSFVTIPQTVSNLVILTAEYNKSVFRIAILPDNSIILGGRIITNSATYVGLKLDQNGSLINEDQMNDYKDAYQITPKDNYIYRTDDNRTLRRLFNNGNWDLTFSAPNNNTFTYFKILPDNKIITSSDGNIVRLNSNGALDTSFNSNLLYIPSPLYQNYNLLGILPDGKIISLLGGSTGGTKISRLNTDGSLDLTFNSGFNFNDVLKSICIQSSGKILLGGIFSNYNGFESNNIVRLKGENYYSIQGENKFDMNANGCDSNDIIFPSLNLQVTSTTNSINYFSNSIGNYKIGLTEGNYTITPTFENQSYFTVSPTSVSVNFPTQPSPVLQNFCITPNGVHPDLEVTLLPLTVARPGFEAKYRLVYKNKGNQLQSGTVNFNFNDAVLNFVSATTAVSSQTLNNLNWSFTNLNPFETKEIVITLLVNTPTATPPVNSGFVLNYTTTISSTQTDEMPSDNTFVYNQTVVNSFDPNDKTCLEGATIATTKVGDYVHYMIRFENTGTYNAQNITVKDVIDTTKFDINSIVPTSGSGLFITRVLEGNRIEFYFENINLPFAVGTNTGYVAFKIKTKATLVAGDSFSNTAGIYFDYNSAITTNTTVTTVSNPLKKEDFEFENYLILFPNPVNDVLNIDKKNNIDISSISIYNTLGQLFLVIPNAKETQSVDVSTLQTGNYFVKINSDKGTATTKFIKM